MSSAGAISKPVTAAILAGGRGTRLQSVLPDKPKAMAEVAGRPFLSFLLDQLSAAGIQRTVLCTGYGADQIKSFFGNNYGAMQLSYSPETKPLGTGGALRLALPLFQSETLLIMNGDSFTEIDLAEFQQNHSTRASLALAKVPDSSRFGRVELNSKNEILSFVEKERASGPGWISAGIYLLDRSVIAEIPANLEVSLEREVFPKLAGKELRGYTGCGAFLDIGTPDSYAQAERFLLPRSGKSQP